MPLTSKDIADANRRGVYIKLPPDVQAEIDRELERERLARNAQIGASERRTKQANRALSDGASDREVYDILAGRDGSASTKSADQPMSLIPVSTVSSRTLDEIPDASRLSSKQKSEQEKHEAHVKALNKALERSKKRNEQLYRNVDRQYAEQARTARAEARRKNQPPIYAEGDIGDFDEDEGTGATMTDKEARAQARRDTKERERAAREQRRAEEREQDRLARMELEALRAEQQEKEKAMAHQQRLELEALRAEQQEKEKAVAHQQRLELAAQRAAREQQILEQRAAQRALIARERKARESKVKRERVKRDIQRGFTNTARGAVVASKKQKYSQARTDGRRYTEAQLRKRKGLPPPERSVGDWIGLGLLGALGVVGFMYVTNSGIFHREEDS